MIKNINETKMEHDAHRQIGYIQQALSQNNKPIGILLGAGCPLSIRIPLEDDPSKLLPLIPDIDGLTKLIIDKLKGTEAEPSHSDRLRQQLEDDGIANPNIENILSYLRSLRQVAGKGTVRDFKFKDLEDLDKEICQVISQEVNKELPSEDSPYHDLAIWARSTPRSKPVHIFTTNYDLLVEQAFEESTCPYFDGFVGSRRAFFDLGMVENEDFLPPRWCRLWKIHGSLNWKLDINKRVVRSDQIDDNESHLIYPSHLKYDQSRKMPYLAMMDRLKEFIVSPSSLLFISGYSFSDDHINDVLVQSLSSNPTAMIFAFLYGNLDDPKYSKALECSHQVSNLSLIGFDKGIIGRQLGNWTVNNEDQVNEIPASILSRKYKQKQSEGDPDEMEGYEIRLGDFTQFGRFLREMSVNVKHEEK